MFAVYLIQSITHPTQTYIGFSSDLKARLNAHNSGKSIHTNKFKHWKLVSCTFFSDKKRALDYESYLKSHSGRAFRKKHF